MNHPLRAAAVLFGALAALSACNHPTNPQAPDSPSSSSSPSAEPNEGAVSAHVWADGFAAKVVSLERLDPKSGDRAAAGPSAPGVRILVKITVTLTNAGTTAVQLPRGRFLWRVLTGPNRFEATDNEGDQFTGAKLTSPVPEQIAPGQSVTLFDSWDVPTDQLSALAVRIDIGGDRTAFTFTDIQTLM